MRDDFSRETVERLAKRAGYLCSKPDCRAPTVGAARSHEGVINVGVAAHITAASPLGPRYDATLTSEERRHISNGVWLCQTHAHLVDADAVQFTIETLRLWKRTSEEESFRSLVDVRGAETEPADRAERLDTMVARLVEEAKEDLQAFKGTPGWPRQGIALNLRVNDGSARSFNASGLAAALGTFSPVVIVAQPGTGKTTTLLQLVDAILSHGTQVAVFVPLGEWSSQSDSLLQSVLRRPRYAGEHATSLHRLAEEGRLVLVLDGWNELDAAARRRAAGQLKSLQRDFPSLGLVISTRLQALEVPVSGPVVEIDALDQVQQSEIARALRGIQGEALLDHAWRTAGIRELVAIPLYLLAPV